MLRVSQSPVLLEGAEEGTYVTITTPVRVLWEKVKCFWSARIFLVVLAGLQHYGNLTEVFEKASDAQHLGLKIEF